MPVQQKYIDDAIRIFTGNVEPQVILETLGAAIQSGANLAELTCLSCAVPPGKLPALLDFARSRRNDEPYASALKALKEQVMASGTDDGRKLRQEGTEAFEAAKKALAPGNPVPTT